MVTVEQNKWISKHLKVDPKKLPAPHDAAPNHNAPTHPPASAGPADEHTPETNASANDAKSNEKGGEEKKEGEGKADGIAVAVFQWLTTKSNDFTLKAQVGSALPKDADPDKIVWQGPVSTIAEYPEEKSLLHLATIAFGQVEVSFYYNGKYIHNFHAKIIAGSVDRTANLIAELVVDDSSASGPGGVARIDWTITFSRGHLFGSRTVSISGRAKGDGTYTTSQPSIADYVQEAMQQGAAGVGS